MRDVSEEFDVVFFMGDLNYRCAPPATGLSITFCYSTEERTLQSLDIISGWLVGYL
jgi:hypothetical protein